MSNGVSLSDGFRSLLQGTFLDRLLPPPPAPAVAQVRTQLPANSPKQSRQPKPVASGRHHRPTKKHPAESTSPGQGTWVARSLPPEKD